MPRVRHPRIRFWLLVLAVALSGCRHYYSPTTEALNSKRDRDWVGVSLLGCLASNCPVFELLLFDDGTVRWEGQHCVEVVGARVFHIPAQRVRALMSRLDAAGITRLPRRILPGCSAHSGVTTLRYQRKGAHHRTEIVHMICEDGDDRGLLDAVMLLSDFYQTAGEAADWLFMEPPLQWPGTCPATYHKP